jgi:hypothetical protein
MSTWSQEATDVLTSVRSILAAAVRYHDSGGQVTGGYRPGEIEGFRREIQAIDDELARRRSWPGKNLGENT